MNIRLLLRDLEVFMEGVGLLLPGEFGLRIRLFLEHLLRVVRMKEMEDLLLLVVRLLLLPMPRR